MALYTADVKVDLDVLGDMPEIDTLAATLRAQEKNAELLEREIKRQADLYVGARSHPSSGEERGTDYGGSMIDHYHAEVDAKGDVIAWNPTSRADYFEFGTEAHEIWASGLFERGQGSRPRGLRGQFSRGARALAFDWRGGRFLGPMVEHPGQLGIPVMAWALEETEGAMGRNLLDELEEEWARG